MTQETATIRIYVLNKRDTLVLCWSRPGSEDITQEGETQNKGGKWNRLHLFPVSTGRCQPCPLSLVLFTAFMEGRKLVEGAGFGGGRMSLLIVADDAVLLVSSNDDLWLLHVAAKCEAARMTISTSESEVVEKGGLPHSRSGGE